MRVLNELALFAGAGGGILGARLLGWRCVCAVEIDPYCREILLRRQEDKSLDPFPIWDDVRTFDGGPWCGKVDVVTAGFPCQPFSVAGQQRGQDDERNMWPDTIRVIRDVGPKWALLENVPGLLVHRYSHAIFGELAEAGYDCQWGCISAASVGANHKRDRLWIVANSNRMRQPQSERYLQDQWRRIGNRGEEISNSGSILLERKRKRQCTSKRTFARTAGNCWWKIEPDVGRVANGVPYWVDRIKALGNGQVPAVVAKAFDELST